MMRCCKVGRHPVTNRYTTAVTGTAIMLGPTAGMRDSRCPSNLASTTRVVIRHQGGPISAR